MVSGDGGQAGEYRAALVRQRTTPPAISTRAKNPPAPSTMVGGPVAVRAGGWDADVSAVDGVVGRPGSGAGGAGGADGSGGANAGSVMAGATAAAAGVLDNAPEDRPTGVGPAAGFAVPAGCAAAV